MWKIAKERNGNDLLQPFSLARFTTKICPKCGLIYMHSEPSFISCNKENSCENLPSFSFYFLYQLSSFAMYSSSFFHKIHSTFSRHMTWNSSSRIVVYTIEENLEIFNMLKIEWNFGFLCKSILSIFTRIPFSNLYTYRHIH